ncbi:metal ABC transporter substrate-binding protein [Halorussus halobius]|uniref:metal ABC transporter substrate-binding protein n=1 Tax=Halorussus halobius TaxID=1710537 RepID=UPI00109313C6|nr:metal ABC transporter substrate-binding protein [Halorussus halobius]
MVEYTRRRMVETTASALAVGSFAGCLSDASFASDRDADEPTAQASFFVFGDFASQVAGDVATAETLVPVGQHGHGWEPGPQIQGDVLDADLFVRGVDGFQPWADDMAGNVREDGGDTALVDVGSNVDLLVAGSRGDGNHDGGGHESHDEGGGHDEAGHDGTTDHGGHDETHHGDGGDHEGTAHEGHDEESSHDGEDGHDHAGGTDPHFWLDPLRAKRAVETVREGFASVDGANADAYAENADAYASRLDDLHASFESALDGASKDVILVAGHDAFGYFADRYGFEVATLTGVSPDGAPTPKDVETAQQVIADHDLDHVLADPLASQRAADQLVAETDAGSVLPLTSIPGRTDEWADRGWGYVDVMTEINLPTLERALGAPEQ